MFFLKASIQACTTLFVAYLVSQKTPRLPTFLPFSNTGSAVALFTHSTSDWNLASFTHLSKLSLNRFLTFFRYHSCCVSHLPALVLFFARLPAFPAPFRSPIVAHVVSESIMSSFPCSSSDA